MNIALQEAQLAMLKRAIPVGAVITIGNDVIAKFGNDLSYSIAHAEILAIKAASLQLETKYLTECNLYTTLEPCHMCAGAISLARIKRLYFGAYDQKSGAIYSGARVFNHCHHVPEVYGGIMEQECANLLKIFFDNIRQKK